MDLPKPGSRSAADETMPRQGCHVLPAVGPPPKWGFETRTDQAMGRPDSVDWRCRGSRGSSLGGFSGLGLRLFGSWTACLMGFARARPSGAVGTTGPRTAGARVSDAGFRCKTGEGWGGGYLAGMALLLGGIDYKLGAPALWFGVRCLLCRGARVACGWDVRAKSSHGRTWKDADSPRRIVRLYRLSAGDTTSCLLTPFWALQFARTCAATTP